MNTYKTIDIARIIGIHVNTVRLYEKCGLIPKPERLGNGYWVFTDLHIEQFRLARAALQVEVLQNGLRKRAVDIIKVSALGNYEKAIGLMVGGVAPDTKTASVAASLLYFPMLIFSGATLPYEVMPSALQKIAIFSGATLPYEVMPSALQKIADVLPLTQGIKLLKATSLGLPLESVWFPIVIMAVVTVVCGGIAIRFFKWE